MRAVSFVITGYGVL